MKKRFRDRPLSYSQLASWDYSKEDWYDNYVLGKRKPPTAEMRIGTVVGDKIGTPDSPIPDLNPPGVKEYPLKAEWENIFLTGYIDHFCPDMLELHENKTSPNKKRWTQSKVDKHDQLTMYALLLHLKEGIEPEDITMYLNFIPVCLTGVTLNVCGGYRQFETKRTKQDLVRYQQYIRDTIEQMDEYIRSRELSPGAPKPPAFK